MDAVKLSEGSRIRRSAGEPIARCKRSSWKAMTWSLSQVRGAIVSTSSAVRTISPRQADECCRELITIKRLDMIS